eukprot:1332793-Amorphochlora_amoeboformis.AAC.1
MKCSPQSISTLIDSRHEKQSPQMRTKADRQTERRITKRTERNIEIDAKSDTERLNRKTKGQSHREKKKSVTHRDTEESHRETQGSHTGRHREITARDTERDTRTHTERMYGARERRVGPDGHNRKTRHIGSRGNRFRAKF